MLSSPGDNNTTVCFQEKSDEAKKVKTEKYFDTKDHSFHTSRKLPSGWA
jgi:hypothetical protein